MDSLTDADCYLDPSTGAVVGMTVCLQMNAADPVHLSTNEATGQQVVSDTSGQAVPIAFIQGSTPAIYNLTVAASGGYAGTAMLQVTTTVVQGQTPFDRQFASKSDGTFLFSNVPAGRYQICVEAPHENVLDPCLWSPTVTVVDISNGAAVSGLAIRVATGYMLQMHVNDPAALLPAPVGGTAGRALSVMAIRQTKQYHNFHLPGASAMARDHYLLVPFDQTLTLAIASSSLELSNAQNQRYSGDVLQVPVRIGREPGAGGGECGDSVGARFYSLLVAAG